MSSVSSAVISAAAAPAVMLLLLAWLIRPSLLPVVAVFAAVATAALITIILLYCALQMLRWAEVEIAATALCLASKPSGRVRPGALSEISAVFPSQTHALGNRCTTEMFVRTIETFGLARDTTSTGTAVQE